MQPANKQSRARRHDPATKEDALAKQRRVLRWRLRKDPPNDLDDPQRPAPLFAWYNADGTARERMRTTRVNLYLSLIQPGGALSGEQAEEK